MLLPVSLSCFKAGSGCNRDASAETNIDTRSLCLLLLSFAAAVVVTLVLDAPVARVNSADVPLSYASTLIEVSLPNAARTVKAVKEVMYLS